MPPSLSEFLKEAHPTIAREMLAEIQESIERGHFEGDGAVRYCLFNARNQADYKNLYKSIIQLISATARCAIKNQDALYISEDQPLYFGSMQGPLIIDAPNNIYVHVKQVHTFQDGTWLSGIEDFCKITQEKRVENNNIPISAEVLRGISSPTEDCDTHTLWTYGYDTLAMGNKTVNSILEQAYQPAYTQKHKL